MNAPALAYDRTRLLDALARLASDDEETVLGGARAAAAILAAARLGWDDLLPPALPMGDPDLGPVAAPTDDGGRIAALLALPDLSADSRETLEEMARDLEKGAVSDADRTWLHALYGRLVGN
ncbi:hypothetical protein STVA_18100 [Allostella vacuolata]|nr:hypothetical protein STVA_18100 [Stella vacuolata]